MGNIMRRYESAGEESRDYVYYGDGCAHAARARVAMTHVAAALLSVCCHIVTVTLAQAQCSAQPGGARALGRCRTASLWAPVAATRAPLLCA